MAGLIGLYILAAMFTGGRDSSSAAPTATPLPLAARVSATSVPIVAAPGEQITVAESSPTLELPAAAAVPAEPVEDVPAEVSLAALLPTSTPEATVQEPPTSEPAPPTPVPDIGQDVVLGNLRWKVLEAADLGNTLTSDNEFIEPASTTGRFIRVVFEIENTDTDRTSFLGVDLTDDQTRDYGSYDQSFMYIPTERFCVMTSLNPNMPQVCEFIFDVPVDATGLKLKATSGGFFAEESLIDLQLQ